MRMGRCKKQWLLYVWILSSALTANGRSNVAKIIKLSHLPWSVVTISISAPLALNSVKASLYKVPIPSVISQFYGLILGVVNNMSLYMGSKRYEGPSVIVNIPNKKRKRKDLDIEEASFILNDIQSEKRVLYLQEVPNVKASHCRAWNCIISRRTHEPIIRSYYRFALKGGSTLYGAGMNIWVRKEKDLWY